MRRGATYFLTAAAIIGIAAYAIHSSLKGLDKPFDDEIDWDDPTIAEIVAFTNPAGSTSLSPASCRGGSVEFAAPDLWITAANRDEDRFARVIARLEAAGVPDHPIHSIPLTNGSV